MTILEENYNEDLNNRAGESLPRLILFIQIL